VARNREFYTVPLSPTPNSAAFDPTDDRGNRVGSEQDEIPHPVNRSLHQRAPVAKRGPVGTQSDN